MPGCTYDPAQFSLDDTLASGQAFRWTRLPDGAWRGVAGAQVLTLRQDGARLTWTATGDGDPAALIRDLFLLDVDLAAIQAVLIAADPGLAGPIGRAPGLRLMRQDPVECLLSFVCSTANNVPRIVAGIARLSAVLGRPIATVDGRVYHTFPTLDALAGADPAALQAATGLGYRAGRLVALARALQAPDAVRPAALRGAPYATAHAALTTLPGVGPKVADCVCLFSLDHTEAVPVDTHIWQVAQHLWGNAGETTKPAPGGVSGAGYRRVGDAFRMRYGRWAGYAQNWLFYDHFRGYWGGTSPLLK